MHNRTIPCPKDMATYTILDVFLAGLEMELHRHPRGCEEQCIESHNNPMTNGGIFSLGAAVERAVFALLSIASTAQNHAELARSNDGHKLGTLVVCYTHMRKLVLRGCQIFFSPTVRR